MIDGALTAAGASTFSARSAVSHLARSVSSHAPSRLNESMSYIASSGLGPRNDDAAVFDPICVA